MLNAIVLEIAVKVIWELDHNRDCKYTHNISKLYGQLTEKSRGDLEVIYDAKSKFLAGLEGTNKKAQRVRIGDLVRMQSLQEALLANEDTMKNFKYNANFNGKSSAMGSVIWSNELIYTIPPLNRERLPEALYKYTLDRVQKTGVRNGKQAEDEEIS